MGLLHNFVIIVLLLNYHVWQWSLSCEKTFNFFLFFSKHYSSGVLNQQKLLWCNYHITKHYSNGVLNQQKLLWCNYHITKHYSNGVLNQQKLLWCNYHITALSFSMVGGYMENLKKPQNYQNWGVGTSTGVGACLGQYGNLQKQVGGRLHKLKPTINCSWEYCV